jgi:hypothetical protein
VSRLDKHNRTKAGPELLVFAKRVSVGVLNKVSTINCEHLLHQRLCFEALGEQDDNTLGTCVAYRPGRKILHDPQFIRHT